jgi:hypothetical protein
MIKFEPHRYTSEEAAMAASKKKGTQYFSTKIKNNYLKNPDLGKAIKLAQKRHRVLLEKMNGLIKDGDGKVTEISDLEIRQFIAITTYLNKYTDKVLATMVDTNIKGNLIEKIIVTDLTDEDISLDESDNSLDDGNS